jgi:hypothetical protein
MGSNNLHEVQTIGIGYVPIPFSFAPNNTSAVDQTSIKGEGISSVTRTGVGTFDVVLKSPWYDILAVSQSIGLATDADVTLSSWKWVAATKTLSLSFRSGGSAADIAANADNRLGAIIWAKNSSVGK